MADVLVVVAHPDDESLFAGAHLARLAANGANVNVVACADGVGSRFEGRWPVEHRAAKKRREMHFHSALRELGAHGYIGNLFPDQQSDAVRQLDINRGVARIIGNHSPEQVFTHHVGDLNVDHRRVAEAVLVATRGFKGQVFSMAPEYPSRCVGPAWNWDREWITDGFMATKLRACLCYVDELRDYPHPRSERAIREQTVERFMEIR